jgi:effector-binding domain-containing protein
VGFPVMDKNAANHRMGGGKCAHAVHKGAYSKLNESYTALAKWVEDNGKQIASAPYEIYLNEPGKVPEEELVTEIYFPIK